MRELIALEAKKNNLKQILLTGLIASGVVFVYICLTLIFGKGNNQNYEGFLVRIMSYNKIAFTIVIALLISKMFGEEISSKSFSILFTYPISRFKLLLTKVVLIVIVICPVLYASMLVHFVLLAGINSAVKFISGSLTGSMIAAYIFIGLLQAICTTFAAFIPLAVDVKYTSGQYTLITAGVMAFFLYSITSKYLVSFELFLMVVFAAIGVCTIKWSLSQIVGQDIM